MARTKYPRDEKNRAILGTQHGVTITRPWNNEMYDHNDYVQTVMKAHIRHALKEINVHEEEEALRQLSKHICGYGFGMGYDPEQILERTLTELERAENWWLNQNYQDMVDEEFVPALEIGFVGFDKLA